MRELGVSVISGSSLLLVPVPAALILWFSSFIKQNSSKFQVNPESKKLWFVGI